MAKEVGTGREFASELRFVSDRFWIIMIFSSLVLVKVCEKRLIKKEKKVQYVTREKEVMRILNENPHPFFVRLYCTCQDSERLCKLNGMLMTRVF